MTSALSPKGPRREAVQPRGVPSTREAVHRARRVPKLKSVAPSTLDELPMASTITTRILHAADEGAARGMLRPWVWPLPRLDGAAPCVLDFQDEIAPDGVALGYRNRFLAPVLVPVFAARDGIVTYAGPGRNGSTVSLDHTDGWSTQYANLTHVLTRPTDRFRQRRKERVQAGDVIGHASRSPLRIRFCLSRWRDGEQVVVDPRGLMHVWSTLPWFSDAPVGGRATAGAAT